MTQEWSDVPHADLNASYPSLRGKSVLITGGGKGIGKGIALAFAQQGAKVAIGCNANPGLAGETLEQLKQHTDAILIPADLADPASARHLISTAVEAFGGLDILICNAAIQTHESMLESCQATLEFILSVNLRSMFLLMKHGFPYLSQSGQGRVILISSVHGKRATDFDVSYAMSKGGMNMLCREAAIELAKGGVTVNIIAPGGVIIEGKTGNPVFSSIKRVARARHIFKYPLGRLGWPKDTAAAACFLASPDAEHITGTTIRVDGGVVLM